MPTYQYVCSNPEGKHEFEVVQSFSDPAVATCPECGAAVRKVYGSVGVVFKGSGFYRTDSRKAESTPAASSSGGKDAGSGSGKDAGSGSGSAAASSGPSSSPSSSSSSNSSSSPSTSGSGSKAAN